jgi:hypothetical protein
MILYYGETLEPRVPACLCRFLRRGTGRRSQYPNFKFQGKRIANKYQLDRNRIKQLLFPLFSDFLQHINIRFVLDTISGNL